MYCKIYTATKVGLSYVPVSVEVSFAKKGLPSFDIVGLPTRSVAESKYRIRAAFDNLGIKFPRKRITVNLTPSDLNKLGSTFDLPIAVGVLFGIYGFSIPEGSIFYGALSLNGNIIPIDEITAFADFVRRTSYKNVFVHLANSYDYRGIFSGNLYQIRDLSQLLEGIMGNVSTLLYKGFHTVVSSSNKKVTYDMSFVRGMTLVKRAFEISAVGRHSVLLVGPPGSGKTLICKTYTSIIPNLVSDESLLIAKYRDISFNNPNMFNRPAFREPTKSMTLSSFLGNKTKYGEVHLASKGVLFFDEFPEFNKDVIDSLKPFLEYGAKLNTFTFIATANPCPCGFFGSYKSRCTCSIAEIRKYRSKISGPILDRIDIFLSIDKYDFYDDSNFESSKPELSVSIRSRVEKAREILKNVDTIPHMSEEFYVSRTSVEKSSIKKDLLSEAVALCRKFNLSYRSFLSILRISASICSLRGGSKIEISDLYEAVHYKKSALDFNQLNNYN